MRAMKDSIEAVSVLPWQLCVGWLYGIEERDLHPSARENMEF